MIPNRHGLRLSRSRDTPLLNAPSWPVRLSVDQRKTHMETQTVNRSFRWYRGQRLQGYQRELLTITSGLTSGRLRQFWVIWQNKRCSILFHLLVPGGKGDTLTSRPVASLNFCNSTFHSRERL